MPDIKLDQPNEKATTLNEKPAADVGQLEKSLENLAENIEKKKFETAEKPAAEENTVAEAVRPAAASSAMGIITPPTKRQKQIENILAEDLTDLYLGLTPQKRQEFKRVGEETAGKISRLLAKAKVNIGEIIKLIKKWLALIPGINKYFLEQAAKIKADELVKLKSEK